jgi:hypothetical protein
MAAIRYLLAFLGLGFPGNLCATTIELGFTGTITTTSSDPGVTPLFLPGDPWSLTFTYEHPHPPDQLVLGQARYTVVGSVHFAVNNLGCVATEFGVGADIPSFIGVGGIATLVGVPSLSVGYGLDFSSTQPLILNTETYSLPASFADWDFPSTEVFELLAGAEGWSARSTTLVSSTIRQVPEPAGAVWAGAVLWWFRRRRL